MSMKNLTNEELAIFYKNGLEDAGNELYIRNQGLIGEVLKVFKNFKRIDYEDKINACNYGFTKAIKYFNESKDVKFSTFCYKLMYNEITRELEHVSRQKRDSGGYNFKSLDIKLLIHRKEVDYLELLDVGDKDVLYHKDYKYIFDAIGYAMSLVMDKYHPYLLPLLSREMTVQQVADKTGFTVYVIRFTFSEFRRHAREYIYKYTNGESEYLANKKG